MIKVRCTEDWISQYTLGKEYEVISTYFPYLLVVDDNGDVKWEYKCNFTSPSKWIVDKRYKYEVNYNIL